MKHICFGPIIIYWLDSFHHQQTRPSGARCWKKYRLNAKNKRNQYNLLYPILQSTKRQKYNLHKESIHLQTQQIRTKPNTIHSYGKLHHQLHRGNQHRNSRTKTNKNLLELSSYSNKKLTTWLLTSLICYVSQYSYWSIRIHTYASHQHSKRNNWWIQSQQYCHRQMIDLYEDSKGSL